MHRHVDDIMNETFCGTTAISFSGQGNCYSPPALAPGERADSGTESVKEQGWTHLEAEPIEDSTKVRAASAAKTTPSPSAASTNAAAPTQTDLKNGRIETALKAMAEMGFNNESDLLRRLLKNYNGDLARALDSIK